MTKWVETKSKKYGPGPNYTDLAKKQDEAEASHKKFMLKVRITGIITTFLGMGIIGLSIFTFIKCLFIGIIVMAIGLAVLWSTETSF